CSAQGAAGRDRERQNRRAQHAMSGPTAVRMAGVVKRFGAVVANAGADLEVASGEIHALVGENGAGKSTLMRVLAGMYPPDGGSVEVAIGGGPLRDVTGWSTRG